jgi:hypothetical protein
MNKYQFYISFNNKPGTASSKAIDDCTAILSSLGYHNYNLTTKITSRFYMLSILAAVTKLLFSIRPNAIVAIQYPLLSGNKLFRYIIRLLRARSVKVLGIVHDLDDLRYQSSAAAGRSDAALLSDYDAVIVHNDAMMAWLKERGVKCRLFSLEIFDYLSDPATPFKEAGHPFPRTIVFAGNLAKSTFIYDLDLVKDWQFNLYGPNIELSKLDKKKNVNWGGIFSTADILSGMDGAFGMIWDGTDISSLDEVYGNYLRFNNPHKLSLYLAAGLPVMVPEDAAIAAFVKYHQVGLILSDLNALNDLEISEIQYRKFSENARRIGKKLKKGFFLKKAIEKAENHLIIKK